MRSRVSIDQVAHWPELANRYDAPTYDQTKQSELKLGTMHCLQSLNSPYRPKIANSLNRTMRVRTYSRALFINLSPLRIWHITYHRTQLSMNEIQKKN